MRKRFWLTLLCVVVAAGLGLAGAIPAATAQTAGQRGGRSVSGAIVPFYGMSELTYQRMLAQIPLDRAVTQIRAAVARPGAGHGGFVQIWVDDDHHLVTVYWHGRVPPDIQRLFTSLRRQVRLRVAAARYSNSQLTQAVNRVMHGRFGVRVVGAGPLPDGSGIDVTVSGGLPAVQLQRLSGVGVDVRVTQVPGHGIGRQQSCVPNPADTLGPPARCYDLAPAYWGGAVINNVGSMPGSYCSTGFGVHSTVDSRVYILTAGHCGVIGDTFMNGNETQTLGKMTHRTLNHDDAMIETPSGTNYYDGPSIFNGDTHRTKVVTGQQPSAIGDMLCVSGAAGGVICGLRISCLNQVVTAGGFTTTRVAEARFTTGGQTIGGDSGGPLFSLAGSNTVTAKGTHIGLWPDCLNGQTDDMFMTIDWISADFKVTVNTG